MLFWTEMMNDYEIGILETRNVIKTLLEVYGYDFRDYALTSFKLRLNKVISDNGLVDGDGLVERLSEDKLFFEYFLDVINPDTTEMFRDPSLWRVLRDSVLSEVAMSPSPKIWLASFDSCEELYSLCIILQELDLFHKVSIYTSVMSDSTLGKMKKRCLGVKKMDIHEANYLRSKGIANFGDYYHQDAESGLFVLNSQLIQGVNFVKQSPLFNNAPERMTLVLFRNQIIYFNQTLQNKSVGTVCESLVPGGYLILGSKETLENTNTSHKFTVINSIEKIYKKKHG